MKEIIDKFKKFLSNDYQWIDLSWLILFIIITITTPYIMLSIGVEWTAPDNIITNPVIMTWYSIIATIMALFGAYLMLRKNKWNAIMGMIGDIILGTIFWMNGLYSLGVITMIISPLMHVFMYRKWNKEIVDGHNITPRHLNKKQGLIVITSIIFGSGILGTILVFLPGGEPSSYVSWLDSILSVMGILGLILSIHAYKEQYWVWVIADLISIIYIALQLIGIGMPEPQLYLIPTFILVVGYLFTSIWGHFKWKKIDHISN